MLSVLLFSWTHTLLKCKAGVTLSVNAFEFWHVRGPSGLARLAKYLICAPSSQAYVEHILSVCGLLSSGRRSATFRSLEMRVCLKLNQRVLKETFVHSNRLYET